MRTLVERLRDFDGIQAEAADEIDRLQEAKRRFSENADRSAIEANGLRQALRTARGLCDDRLGPSRASLLDKIANVIDAALEEKGA